MNRNIPILSFTNVNSNSVILEESSVENNVPLKETEFEKLLKLRTYLIDNIYYPIIAERLYNYGVFSENHKQSIESKPEEFKRVNSLLHILQRRSRENLHQFLLCLRENHHDFVAKFVEKFLNGIYLILLFVILVTLWIQFFQYICTRKLS